MIQLHLYNFTIIILTFSAKFSTFTKLKIKKSSELFREHTSPWRERQRERERQRQAETENEKYIP